MRGRLARSVTPEAVRRLADEIGRQPETSSRAEALADIEALAVLLERRPNA